MTTPKTFEEWVEGASNCFWLNNGSMCLDAWNNAIEAAAQIVDKRQPGVDDAELIRALVKPLDPDAEQG